MMNLIKKIYKKVRSSIYLKMAIKGGCGKIYLGKNVFIHKNAIIYLDGEELIIGDNTIIHEFVYIRLYGGKIIIGSDCSINPFSVLYGHGTLRIGNGVRIAAHCTLIPANHKYERLDIPIFMQGETMKGITIEDDVWLGTGVKVLDGVTIHRGSVIGAGSVVTKDIPPFSIAYGVPARVVKRRGEI